jgi:hypothetical protein
MSVGANPSRCPILLAKLDFWNFRGIIKNWLFLRILLVFEIVFDFYLNFEE